MTHYLSLILSTPLAGAVLLTIVPRRHERIIRWCATLVAAIGFALAVPLWFLYDAKSTSYQFVERLPWVPSIGAQYSVGVDGLSTLLILLMSLMGCLAIVSSWTVVTERVKEHFVCLLVLQAGTLGAVMALDFLLFFVFWLVMLVPMCLLVGVRGAGNRRSPALGFFACALVGSAVLLFGILVLYFAHHTQTGVYSFDVMTYQQVGFDSVVQWWAFLALCIGFGIHVPMFPVLARWPDASAKTPAAGSVMPAAAFLTMGTYGFLRFNLPILPQAAHQFAPVIAAACLAAVVCGGLVARAQRDWTRLIAYTSVGQVAIGLLGVMALNPVGITGGIVQLINHSISTAALFLLVGVIAQRRHTRDILEFGGLSRVMPIYATIFLLFTVSAVGLPALGGFIGEFLIVQGVFTANRLWAVVAAGGLAIGAAATLSLYRRTMLGPVTNPQNEGLADISGREVLVIVPLLALTVWIGLYPKPLLDRLATSVDRIVARVSPEYGQNAMAECGAPPTAETAKTNPAAAFLSAVPCGPDGKPLPQPEATAPH